MKLNIKIPKIPKITIYGIDVIKNFLFFTLFIIITLLAIAVLISPAVSSYKKAKKEYLKTKYELDTITLSYKEKLKELNKLKSKNQKVLNDFKKDFNYKNFKLFSSKYMYITSIKEINKTTFDKNFLKTTYILKADIKSPKNFYNLVDALKNYKNVIRIYFPINFIKNKEDINLTLKIEHYKLKDAQNALLKAH